MAAELYRCANCSFEADREDLPDAKDLFIRLEAGGIFTDKECPKCGALAFPVKEEKGTVKGFMRMEEALEIVLQLAGDNITQEATDRHMPEAEKEEMTNARQTALDTVEDFYHNVIMEGRHYEGPPPKVLIWMERGLIQSIDATQEVEALVIDEDTEGGDEENIRTIKLFGDESKETDFYTTYWGIIEPEPEVTEHYFNEAGKERPEPEEKEFTISVKETSRRKIKVMATSREKAQEKAREVARQESKDPTNEIKTL
jgi:hypothetical protein